MSLPAEDLKKNGVRVSGTLLSGSPAADDPRWPVVLRVVSGPTFARAARLSQFLLYVCERAILGRVDEVSEQQVGMHVFGRAADYNSNDDNIVRTHARLLRKKLDEYYAAEGKGEPLRILIPKGGYLPVFEVVEAAAVPLEAPEQVTATPEFHWRKAAAIAIAILMLAAGAALYQRAAARRPNARVRQFWSQMFNAGRPTWLVPSDTGYVLHQNYTHRTLNLTEYLARDFWKKFDASPGIDRSLVEALASLPYTNQVDLNFCWRLGRSGFMDLQRAAIRAPRELTITDLKEHECDCHVGARRGNPWAELFDQHNTFQGLFDETTRDYVMNHDPRPGEAAMYREYTENGWVHAYAVVAFTCSRADRTGECAAALRHSRRRERKARGIFC